MTKKSSIGNAGPPFKNLPLSPGKGEDRENLSRIFLEKGENLIKEGKLAEALPLIENALNIKSDLRQGWLTYAKANFKLAVSENNNDLAIKAHELFSHAELLYRENDTLLPVESLWDWGSCLFWSSKFSEEALDLKMSIDKFREVYSVGFKDPSFLLEYGTAIGELGVLIGNLDLIIESATLFNESLERNGDHPLAWLRLACTYKILYFLLGEVEFYEKADHSFVAAARVNAEPLVLWLNWGQLAALEGKTTRDPDLLRSALERLERADLLKPDDPMIITSIADTLMHLGVIDERLDLLKESIINLELAHSLNPDYMDAICLHGHALVNMGKYLSDAKYVEQAIQKFQMGLSRFANAHHFWHGLASANFTLGDMTHDITLYDKTGKFCAQAIELGADIPEYWNDWGIALMRLGEATNNPQYIASAIEKFEQAIHCFNRKSSGVPDPDWFYNYGCALDWLGDAELNPLYFERSIAILSRILDQYPEFNYVRYNLGLALYHLGDLLGEVEPLEQAIVQFETYLLEEQEDDCAWSDLGLVCLTIADLLHESTPNEYAPAYFAKAEQLFVRALSLGNSRTNYYMACLYSLQGNFPDALHYVERSKAQGALPLLDDLLEDEWLVNLRQTKQFQTFLKQLSE